MTLTRGSDGIYRGLFRRGGAKPMRPLHLSMRTRIKKEAQSRHDAVQKLVRQHRDPMIDQMRSGLLSVERVTAMVEHHELLMPIALEQHEAETPAVVSWETVDAAAARYADWYESHPNRADATRRNAAFQLKRFRDFVWDGMRLGDVAVDRVSWAAVEAYQKSMIDADVPVNTITTYVARVPALYRWLVQDEARSAREAERPARTLYAPIDPDRLRKETHRRDRVLTVAEADALMARTPAPYKFPVACGLLAGLRIGETLHLRPVLDVDVEVGTINIRKQPDWRPKTKRAIRLVPMSEPLLQLARRHLEDFASDQWMMPSTVYAGYPLTELGFRRHFLRIVEGSGLVYGREAADGVVYHTLRHTFASHAVMRGVDLYTVAKLLGDSLKTVEDVYADLSPDHKRAAVSKLASAFRVDQETDELEESDTTGDTEPAILTGV